MDKIVIEGLELWTRIGVPDEERTQEQRVIATIEIALDTRAAAAQDDDSQSIDYEKVTEDVRALAREEKRTLERFAEDIAKKILLTYRPQSVTVTLTKFPPPGVRAVRMTITRPT